MAGWTDEDGVYHTGPDPEKKKDPKPDPKDPPDKKKPPPKGERGSPDRKKWNQHRRHTAVVHIKEKVKAKGKKITHPEALVRAKKAIQADRAHRAFKFDFALDGAGTKDKDFGTRENNEARRKAAMKRANVKNALKPGTGRKLKPKV